MAQANVSFRMDEDLKKQAEAMFNDFGMNMTTAFTIFAKTVVREGRIPFEISVDIPNAETIKALEETERISRDPNVKKYASFSELLKEVQDEV